MKRLNTYLMIIGILLFILTIPVMSKTQYIDIVNILGGVSTDPARPVSYLIDGNSNTNWGFLPGEKQAWVEVRLKSNTLIQALEIEGYLDRENLLQVEYYQDGQWLPFMASLIDELDRKDIIDLSYDQVVSDRVRLMVTGNNISRSYISELKVLGIPANEYYHKIEPVSIIASANTDPVYPAEFLVDGNTYTLWKTVKQEKDWQDRKFDEVLAELNDLIINGESYIKEEENSGNNQYNNAELIFNFGEEYLLENTKLYLTENQKGSIELYTYLDGNWVYLDKVVNKQPGWLRLNLSEKNIRTEKVKIVVSGYGGELGGISELEFWGKGNYRGEKPVLIGNQYSVLLNKELNRQFELSASDIKDYTLELAIKASKSDKDSITIELNGLEINLEKYLNIRGYTIYKKEVEKERFWVGENYLRISAEQNLSLANVRLSESQDYNNDAKLGDRLLFTSFIDSSEIEIGLKEQVLSLPEFPAFVEVPNLQEMGSLKIENWSRPTIIDQSGSYDTLIVNTELRLDTGSGDLYLVVKKLELGSNANITINGPGKVHLFLDGDLYIRNGSRINGAGNDNLLELYHSGDKIEFQGGIGGQEKYKFAGTIYTKAREIYIQNGANFKGKLYSLDGDLKIQGGATSSALLYTRTGNIIINNGAKVSGQIISGGEKIEIFGGSIFDGDLKENGIIAPYAAIYIDQGATIKGTIFANPEKVQIANINHRDSFYRIPNVFNENKYIEEITVYSLTDNPNIYLYAWVENNWVELIQRDKGLKSISFNDYVQTDKLKIYNPEGLPITEVAVKYSSENNREADVKILWPEDNMQYSSHELANEKIIGYVDNPDTIVTINGQEVYKRGHYFWLEANRIGTGNNQSIQITAVAKDSKGMVNYDTKTIYISSLPLLEVNLEDKIIYTKDESLRLSGVIRNPLNQLKINGKLVNLAEGRFNEEIKLKEGLNLIEIEGIKTNWQGEKEFSKTVYRKVVKLSPIYLKIDPTLDGCYTNKDTIIVSGYVDGVGEYKVKVNGKDALIEGGNFKSLPVSLVEGSNRIRVELYSDTDEVIEEIIVNRDTIAPVLSEILPVDGSIANKSIVVVSGEVIDKSPVQVYVNDQLAALTNTAFNKKLSFIDGSYQISIKAVDMAGNEADYQINILVDTEAPEPFEVKVDPEGWTNNTEPIISFSTTDKTSGISHYLFSINDGEYIEITSPYKLPAQEDGEHTITVKAVDNAGWETISTTKVYIDTTPPITPENIRVIPGNSKIILKWDSPSGDVIEYIIYKNNGDKTGIDDTTAIYSVSNEEFIDDLLLNGEIYSYSLLAIDRAGNRSLISEWKKGIVGLAEIEYDPEEGGFIEYEDVALVIPKQQLPEGIEKITITEISSQELEEAMIFPQIGPIYEFSAYKTGSIIPEENIELENGYLAKLKYDESLLPEGFPEENLGVYHFDPMFGRWFQIPSAGVDIENNEIYFVTNHFSSFSVQATMIQDLTPQEYKDAGYSPLKAYVEHGGITVSPQFGTASTEVTELVLPGRNGFDFVLKRRYDTATARNDAFALGINVNIGINLTGPNKDYDVLQKVVDTFLEQTNWANTVKGNLIQMLEEYLFNQGDFAYSVGQGWRLNIPYIKAANSSMILRTADGTMHYINEMELVDVPLYIPKLKRTLVFEQHEGADFTLIVEQQYSPVDFMHLVAQSVSADNPDVMKNAIKSSWYSTGYTLILKDGTRYEMDALGRTTKMVDPTGQNQIEFHYDGVHLDYIKDSVGRIIRFEYRNDLLWPRIKKIWIENDPLGREINYDVGLDNLLYSVRDIAGRTSYYKYDTRLLYGGQAGVTFNIGDMILKLVGDILMGPVASLFGDDDIELFGNLKAQLVFPMEEMVAPGQGMTRINYNQPTLMYGKCDVKEIFDILPVSVTLSANLEQFLLTDKVDVYLDSRNKIKTVNFSYDFDYYKAQQPINFRTIENEGERKIVYNYKPVSQKRYRWEDKTYTIVKWEDASVIKQAFPVQYWTEHTLGVLDSMEIIDTTNDKRLQREEYQYDLDTMRIIAKRTIRDNESNLEKYRYDNWGNIIYYQNEDNGLERYMHYLNTSSSLDDFPSAYINLDDSDFYQVEVNKYIHNLMVDSFVLNQNPVGDPVPVHIHNVYSSNGKLILQANWDNQQNKWIKSRFTYDQYGNIIQQIDPLGNITEIDYDPEYNYAYPTTIIVKGKNGEAIRDVDGKPIKGDYIITQIGYYKSSGLKKWEIDGEGNLTEYEYDALGRLIKIIYPDDDDKYSGTIGSLKPEYYSNRDNNPVKIQHYDDDRLETTVINASRNIAVNDSRIYDNTITDPVYNKSRYVYDKLGRWIKLETFNLRENGTTEILTASFYYDKYNRQIAVQDAEGYITFTEYDVLDRETKVILPDGSKDLTNSKDNQIYTEIRYKGNMRTIIDGEGNRTEEISDWSGNLIEVNKYLNEEKISTRVKYDQLGNQVEIIDAEGRVLQRKYDSLGRLIEETLSEDEYIRPIAEKDWDKNNNFISQRYKPKKLYFYDDAGRRIKEISANSYWLYGLVNNTAVYSYEYDEAGNLIKETDPAGNTIRHYYDRNGNVVKTIDQEGNIIQREYTARGWLKAEALVNGALSNKADISAENGENDLITFYRYDLIGNRIAETGPEGVKKVSAAGEDVVILFDDDIYEHNERPYYKIDPEYTLHIEYNRLGWVVKEKRVVAGEEYTTNYEYDKNGNVKEIINPAGQRVVYNYTPQYWLSEEIRYDDSGKEYITAYQYDKVGNQILVTDPAGKRTSYAYDDLNRLESVTDEDGRTERYSYDRVGNMTVLINGRGISTKYEYNNQNQLVKVIDGENGVSNYYYDPEGNLMLKILPNGIKTAYIYDRRNQLVREIRPEGDVIKYSYDKAGNLIKEIDRKGQEISYSYRRDYLPLKIEYRDTEGNLLEYKEYTYDREGKRLTARNNDSLIRISYDPLGRIVSETRTIAGKIYTTAYKYDKVGNIIGIKYPGSYTYLQYEYNDLNQLVGVAGIADGSVQNPAFSYKDNGFLERIRYNNGTITNISPDRNYRIDRIEVINNNPGFNEKLLDISYRYDENNNVIKRINNLTEYSNQYHYDNLDRLVSADLEGTFYGERTGFIGIAEEDQLRYRALRVVEDYFVELDYRANSVGVILLEKTEIGKIVLTPLPGIINHRIRKETISVHYSDDNFIYLKVPEEDWEFEKDEQGRITITLKEAIPAVAFKVHSNHDDRNLYNEYVNLSTFKNNSDEIIKVYQRADEGKIEYSYDAGGNRLERHTIVGNDDITRYEYYKDSNRLKKAIYSISGKTYKEQYYIYDENGNLIAKGNEAKENPDGSLVLIKDSPSSIYWEYEYTADNRLKRVYYNGELKAEYTYDADGMRIISDTEEVKTYFVFNYQGKAIFEENLSSSKTQQISFIYALNRQIARVEGIIGGDGEIIYYHHDNLGSTRLMTDESGEVVFDQDYLPFGGDLAVVGELEPVNEVNEGYKYTGQREEAVIGLYYYGARFYDPEMGRFITEDPAQDGINWYVYCGNNPLNRIDPTGLAWIFDYETWEWYATESSDTIHDLVKSAHFFSWQEAAEHAGIRDWYDDVGNVLGNRSLVGMRIKAPLDIYKAQSFAPELTIFEIGLNDIGIILSGNVTEVTVENVRTFDAFSTSLYSYILDSKEIGFSLPNISISFSTMYGAFPRHYSDFLTNEKHREELYNSLLGETKVHFTNFIIATYARVESDYWRGESASYGFGMGFKYKNYEIGGFGKGTLTQMTPYEQKLGFGKIKLISGHERLMKEKDLYERYIGIANSSGLAASRGKVDYDWEGYLNSLIRAAEREYYKYWR